MNKVIALLAALMCLPSNAAPFHYLLAFPTQAAAIADPIVGQWYITNTVNGVTTSAWRGDMTIPGVLAYIPANSVPTSCGTNPDGSACTYMQPVPYDSNWLLMVSLPARNADLEAESTTHIIFDVGIGGPAGLLYSWIPASQLSAVILQPIWQGSTYPFGNP